MRRPSILELAAIGRAHFGNPIPPEWYVAANALLDEVMGESATRRPPAVLENMEFEVELPANQEERYRTWSGLQKMSPWRKSVLRLTLLINTSGGRGLIDYEAAGRFANQLVERMLISAGNHGIELAEVLNRGFEVYLAGGQEAEFRRLSSDTGSPWSYAVARQVFLQNDSGHGLIDFEAGQAFADALAQEVVRIGPALKASWSAWMAVGSPMAEWFS